MDRTTPETTIERRQSSLSAAQAQALLALGGGDGEVGDGGGPGAHAGPGDPPGVGMADPAANPRIRRQLSAITLAVLGVVVFSTILPPDSLGIPSNARQPDGSVPTPRPGIGRGPRGVGTGSPSSTSQESQTMFAKIRNAAVATTIGAAAITGGASAQAVQWRVEDGGNGHWYQAFGHPERLSWTTSDQLARAMNGHLVTITSAAESAFLSQKFCGLPNLNVPGYRGPWFGLRYVAGAWGWITGEPLQYTAWAPGQPDYPGSQNFAGWGPCEQMWGNEDGDDPYNPVWLMVEWSADCNNDGVVDFGQILAGQLADADGNNIPDCCESGTGCSIERHVPAQYPTIQAAINAALPGDRVLVAPGTYHEQVNMLGKNILLTGTAGPMQTIIDGDGSRTVLIGAGEPGTCVIRGFTITHGRDVSDSGGGGAFLAESALRLVECRFVENTADGQALWSGGGLYASGGAVTIEDCAFIRNKGRNQSSGAAIYHMGGGSLVVRRSIFDGNICNYMGDHGNGQGTTIKLHAGGGAPVITVDGCDFVANGSGVTTGVDPNDGSSEIGSWLGVLVNASNCRFAAANRPKPYVFGAAGGASSIAQGITGCGYRSIGIGSVSASSSTVTAACADCNRDGVPDLEQLIRRTVADSNNDGIPDVCQCEADLNFDGVVNGADLAVILAFWGPASTVFPAADINRDGRVDGFDLSVVLGAWGPCGQ